MKDTRSSPRAALLTYVVYGVVTCAVILVPWIAVEQLVERIPLAGSAIEALWDSELPTLSVAVIIVLGTVLALALVGWVVRKFLWDRLASVPILATFTSGVEQVSEQLLAGSLPGRDRVVWVPWPSEELQTIGVVTGPGAAPGETQAWLTVVMLPTAGQVTGGMLRRVRSELVTYPGWTIDEALAFVSTSGVQDCDARVSKGE